MTPRAVHDLLVDWRNDAGVHLEERFRRAVDEGDLPRYADPRHLARFIMTMGFGIAVQATNGLGPAELHPFSRPDTTLSSPHES